MTAGADAWWRRAEEELRAAHLLREGAFPLQAYHHAGQAIEFGLKAIFLRRKGLPAMPADTRGANWHDLAFVAKRAGLVGDLRLLRRHRLRYRLWLRVVAWDSGARFPGNTPRREVVDAFFLAVVDEQNGVMPWLGRIFRET